MKNNRFSMYTEGLSTSNCNCRLTDAYCRRDNISRRIDQLIGLGLDPSEAEKEYDEIYEAIDLMCRFR